MREGPWIRFFPSDWLAGTRGMTAAETGIYITLIAMMYERGEPIPNDTSRLARLCGTTTAALRSTLSTLVEEGKITLVDGALWNERVGVETENRRGKSTSAQKSAETRWQKKEQKQQADDANAMRPESERNATRAGVTTTTISRKKESVPSERSDASVDWRAKLWSDGLSSLMRQTGKTEGAARQLLGKWSRDAKDDCRRVFDAVSTAEKERIGDPVSWVSASVKTVSANDMADFAGKVLREMENAGHGANGSPFDPGDSHRNYREPALALDFLADENQQ